VPERADHYDPRKHAERTGLDLVRANLDGTDSIYVRADCMILLRAGIHGPRYTVALAQALARHDLERTSLDDVNDTEARYLALDRLLPKCALARAIVQHTWDPGAIAATLDVLPETVTERLHGLSREDMARLVAMVRYFRDLQGRTRHRPSRRPGTRGPREPQAPRTRPLAHRPVDRSATCPRPVNATSTA
jgi:hypothetical protein